MKNIWFSLYDFSFDYKGDETPYIQPDDFDWAKELSANAGKIKEELSGYLSEHNLQSYFNASMVTRQNSWRTIALKTWCVQLFKNQKHFPFTTSLLNKYPQIVSASFNLLEPKSKIIPHCGDTNAIYRCHLGIEIPDGLPACGLKVKGESRSWENGKWLVFMDAYVHEAWNDSNKERYIFLIDVMRQEFAPQKKYICATVLTSLFLQKRAQKFKFLFSNANFVKVIGKSIRPFAQMALFVVNKIKFY